MNTDVNRLQIISERHGALKKNLYVVIFVLYLFSWIGAGARCMLCAKGLIDDPREM